MSPFNPFSEEKNEELQRVPLSALQHYVYCPRQWGLIHMDQEFQDNVHTLRGDAVHALVDIPESEMRGERRLEKALPLYSQKYGLTGKADMVEISPEGIPYPIEYKHGSRKNKQCDDIQLAAQALCLEEMMGVPVPEGAIYYHTSKRRRVVKITPALKQLVLETAYAIRQKMEEARLPPAMNDERCTECSLKSVCQPFALTHGEKAKQILDNLYGDKD